MTDIIPPKRSLADILGIPSKEGIKEFKQLALKFKFLGFIYLLLLFFYILIFGFFKDRAICFLSWIFGDGFGVSFSASALEDLLMFIFLTLAVSIISIKESTKNPEDHEFDSRIKAIMNSTKVKNNYHVLDFLKERISILLAYNKFVSYDVYISDYLEVGEERIFQITVKRIQVMTNMCKDRDFESQNRAISIEPDACVNNSYGKVLSLEKIDPANFSNTIEKIITTTDNHKLDAGLNTLNFNYVIEQDAELAIELIYEVFSKIEEIKVPNSWSFCALSRFTSGVNFSIHNQLKNGQNIKLNVKKTNVDATETIIDEDLLVSPGIPYQHIQKNVLPLERILYHVDVSTVLLLEK